MRMEIAFTINEDQAGKILEKMDKKKTIQLEVDPSDLESKREVLEAITSSSAKTGDNSE